MDWLSISPFNLLVWLAFFYPLRLIPARSNPVKETRRSQGFNTVNKLLELKVQIVGLKFKQSSSGLTIALNDFRWIQWIMTKSISSMVTKGHCLSSNMYIHRNSPSSFLSLGRYLLPWTTLNRDLIVITISFSLLHLGPHLLLHSVLGNHPTFGLRHESLHSEKVI